MINYVLFQFTLKFGGKLTDRLNWPVGVIEFADRSFNPVLEWRKVSARKSMGGELGESPNELIVLDEEIVSYTSVVNSHGEILVKHIDDEIKIISRNGKTKVVKLPEPRESELIKRHIAALAVNDSNNIYVVSYLETRTETDIVITYVLHVLDDGYNAKHVGTLDFLEKIDESKLMRIAINKSNDIAMIRRDDDSAYIVYNTGKVKHRFEPDLSFLSKLSISNTNETMISSHDSQAVNFYTEEGNLTSTVKLPEGHEVYGMAFHYVLGKIIVLTYVRDKGSCFLLCYSEAGELESSTFFCDVIRDESMPSITSHPGGPVAVVRMKSITFI